MLKISRVSDNEVSECTSNPCVFQTALFHLLLLFAQHDVIKVISPLYFSDTPAVCVVGL